MRDASDVCAQEVTKPYDSVLLNTTQISTKTKYVGKSYKGPLKFEQEIL